MENCFLCLEGQLAVGTCRKKLLLKPCTEIRVVYVVRGVVNEILELFDICILE